MSSHVYHEVFVHLNWHTKNDLPLLQGPVEELTHRLLREKCRAIKGAHLHGLGGTDTHVHLAMQIEPFVTMSEVVQELKGNCSHEINKRSGRKLLHWQRGCGVVGFGRKHLAWVLDYIDRQREQHANGTIRARLEAIASPGERESPAEAGSCPDTVE